MKISEKAALAMAGYTKAEIEAMEKPAQPAPAAVQNPVIPQQVPPTAAPATVQNQTPEQNSGQYDGMESFMQQLLGAQQATTQALQTMTQTMQANAVGMGIQQQPAASAELAQARIINPMYGKKEGDK